MAGGGKDEDLGDVYEILGIEEPDPSDKDIQAAYRKGSLKCHPDRNPDDPDAAQKFDRLTRAKDLLLDPIRRAELDRGKKAKKDLEARHAQEDSKRRKLREDLEGREGAANSRSQAAKAAADQQEARRKHLQQDFAARIRAREAQHSGRSQEVAAEVAEARSTALEARVRLTWRTGSSPSIESIRKELATFEVKSMEIGESSAVVQLASREDALGAVLYCRERRHQMPFRVTMASVKTSDSKEPAAPAARRASAIPDPVKVAARPRTPPEDIAGKSAGHAFPTAPSDTAGGADVKASNFVDWEAEMMASIARGAAAAKRG
ncbi:unnamed protein product [Polarella glacialis]|uniref:J domain-containing protein n=1 Tax=Polarella glacialis TaxID=89957 RepID=A0A813G8Y7_POLGL|nr:unnamed protein product [Polarella glacialis]CAE8718013.1 unnamed protein product [Polarella glacialis]|mmetsp:Transcript_8593/g.13619  ORF Transcript_8593/g.13619 Transcript_8593/m.13619 type:complete len:320 (-) Transcript_8593:115-1074(-)